MSDVKPCQRCGKHFNRPARLSAAQWGGRQYCSKRCSGLRRKAKDSEIITLYEGGLSCEEIAPLVGVSATQVGRIVKSTADMRTRSEALKLSHNRPEVREKISAAKKGVPCPDAVRLALAARVGSKNHNWRSGLTMTSGGYLSFTASPANGEHAAKCLHVVIAEWKIGRALCSGEVVHHRDENKLNNEPGNLEVMTHSEHARLHALQNGLGLKNVG